MGIQKELCPVDLQRRSLCCSSITTITSHDPSSFLQGWNVAIYNMEVVFWTDILEGLNKLISGKIVSMPTGHDETT